MLAASVRSLSLPLNQLKPSGNSSLLNGFGSLTWCAWRNFTLFPPCVARSSTWRCHVYESYLVRFQANKRQKWLHLSFVGKVCFQNDLAFRPLRGLVKRHGMKTFFVSCSGPILQYLQKALRRRCLLAFGQYAFGPCWTPHLAPHQVPSSAFHHKVSHLWSDALKVAFACIPMACKLR